MVEFAQVDVKEIRSDRQRSEFDETKINKLADCILKSEFLVRPLLLKQESFDSYLVLEGHLEYYSAVRAKEKDARRGEMINAIVIPLKFDGELDSVTSQIKLLEDSVLERNKGSKVHPSKATGLSSKENSSSWITSFETRLSSLQSQIQQDTLSTDRRFNVLEKTIENTRIDLLEALNTSTESNLIKVLELIKRGKTTKKLAEALITVRQQKSEQKFESYKDIVDSVQGFSAASMLALIEKYDWAKS